MFKIEGVNFFKYITLTACTDQLEIPLGHCWNKKGLVFPDSVILKDNNGNTWPVKLRKVEKRVCFVGADWLKFVQDNRIEPGYFLVVLLNDDEDDDGPNVFSFVLLDSLTQLETGGFLGPSHVLPSVQPSSSSFLAQDSSAAQEEDLISNQSVEESDDDVNDNDDDDDDEKEDDSDQRNDEECPTEPTCQGNTSSARAKRNTRALMNPYGDEIFRSRGIPRPKNPYFVFYMNPKRPNELRIPFKVVQDYKPYLPKNAKIRDPQGTEWETVLSKWKDGRVVYQGACGSFLRVHHVQEGEPCVCELKYRDGDVEKELILDVYKVSG